MSIVNAITSGVTNVWNAVTGDTNPCVAPDDMAGKVLTTGGSVDSATFSNSAVLGAVVSAGVGAAVGAIALAQPALPTLPPNADFEDMLHNYLLDLTNTQPPSADSPVNAFSDSMKSGGIQEDAQDLASQSQSAEGKESVSIKWPDFETLIMQLMSQIGAAQESKIRSLIEGAGHSTTNSGTSAPPSAGGLAGDGASGAIDGATADPTDSRQQEMYSLSLLVQRQNEMYSAFSAIQNQMHQNAMDAVNQIAR